MIEMADDEISDQEYRARRLQKKAKRVQYAIDEDRDVLVLFCQQFAFAADMVGACADILTCSGTQLAYRADVFGVDSVPQHQSRPHSNVVVESESEESDHGRD